MSDVARPRDLSDFLEEFVDRRPVQAVQLKDATVIAHVGRWINESGWVCSWSAAHGSLATKVAGAGVNRLVIYQPRNALAGTPQSAGLTDWVIRRRDGEFHVMSDSEFRETHDPVFRGEVG